jgi:replicative DNA helicase
MVEKGLPVNLDAEKWVLGSILLDDRFFVQAAAVLVGEDFSIERHRHIFRRMGDLHQRKECIDVATVGHELMRFGELEGDGPSYLCSLLEGLPQVPNIDFYIRTVKETANLRRIIFASQHVMNRALTAHDSANDIAAGAIEVFRNVYRDPAATKAEDAAGIIREAGGIEAFLEPRPGISTPWQPFNYATNGWQKGDLSLVAARPSIGKTALALNAVWHAVCQGVPSVFYSYEMSRDSIIKRLISMLARVTYPELIRGELTATERHRVAEATALIQDKPISIVASAGKTVLGIRAHAERAKREGRLELMVVDYIGLVRSTENLNNWTRELGLICREFKEMAGELDVPSIVLSQLSRASERRSDPKPILSDLRDSGNLEEHADLVIMLHREGYYHRDDASLRTHAELNIAKQRNGDTPILRLEFEREYGIFK